MNCSYRFNPKQPLPFPPTARPFNKSGPATPTPKKLTKDGGGDGVSTPKKPTGVGDDGDDDGLVKAIAQVENAKAAFHHNLLLLSRRVERGGANDAALDAIAALLHFTHIKWVRLLVYCCSVWCASIYRLKQHIAKCHKLRHLFPPPCFRQRFSNGWATRPRSSSHPGGQTRDSTGRKRSKRRPLHHLRRRPGSSLAGGGIVMNA